ncbi:MAG: NAD(P)H-dependent oxidoreductase [Oscillospiraceae bacterium]|nr:NAD(P)H-dependent oxidoreductase [Oscillospiraceae bacterium]
MLTIIHGGHREGLCFNAYKTFAELLDQKGVEYRSFSLRNQTTMFCCGEQPCHESAICIHDDVITNEIIPAISQSDKVIIFTPTYFNMPPAMLKNLFDRCNALLVNENRKHPNIAIWVSGQTEVSSIEDNVKCIETFAEVCELSFLDEGRIIRIEDNIENYHLNKEDMDKLTELASKIII